ncbi:hypothetical protein JQ629_01385 [Bradyrhizobium sp. AUGA SZCCT0222]|uniref:hypothetical protein n=1 Tax=Bradyrhizobium sp. AUGA SZCCT0222 TaxID=2807668 RepID=UPI001BA7275E|nr:hypothetical protein [Bradyrhizobium sp. AUGA SZCCT0222]MBR1266155.1 hypothetical protein [Bradyrhizobium sp. AUGA SZCCT0222]
MSRKESFIADRRGAVAFEMPIVYIFLVGMLLMPLADVGVAGIRYISAWQALRAFGQSIQYSPPPDFTNMGGWTSSAIAKADSNFPISNFQVICGVDTASCSTASPPSPKYYSYSTSITLAPIVLRPFLCTSGAGNPCTFTLRYSQRFQ